MSIERPKEREHSQNRRRKQSQDKEAIQRKALLDARKNRKVFSNPTKKLAYNAQSAKVQRLIAGSTLSVYASRIADWLTKGWGKQNTPDYRIPVNKFAITHDKLYTTYSVKLPLALIVKGNELPLGWLDYVRGELRDAQNRFNSATGKNLSVSLNRVVDASKSDIAFSSDKRLQNDYRQMIESNNFDSNDEKALTYQWLQSQEMDDESSLWNTREFLELFVSNGDQYDTVELAQDAYEIIRKTLNKLDISGNRMYLIVQHYYDSVSPIGHHKTKGRKAFLFKKIKPVIREGKYIAGAANLRQGSISDEVGIPVGVDINSGLPIFVDYSDNHLPPSTIVSATTGSGKTFLMQTILAGFLEDQETYFPIVIDYKSEYEDFGRSAGMQIISSSPSEGIYFDTIEIPEPTGNDDIDERMKSASLETTDHVFEILLGDSWNNPGIKEAFTYARRSLYRRRGVLLDDKTTWKRSKGLTFHAFYSEINYVLQNDLMQASEESSRNDFINLRRSLSEYFEKDGARSNYFRRPIRMDDINSGRGVIFALDRKGESGDSSNDVKLMLTMQFIMHILNAITERKSDKRLVPIYWEETNQLLLIPNIASMISSLTTGGRSRGIRNFFITNSPSQIFMAEKESKFSKVDPALISTILSNAQSVIVGPNQQKDMKLIADRYNMTSKTLSAYLDLLSQQASEDNSDNSALAHKFILRHRGKTTLMQAISNPALTESNLFGTEVKVRKNTMQKEQEDTELMKSLLERRTEHTDGSRIIDADRERIYDRLSNVIKKNNK